MEKNLKEMQTKVIFLNYLCGCFVDIHGCGVVERTLLDLVVRNGTLTALVSEKGGRQNELHEVFHTIQENPQPVYRSVFVYPFDLGSYLITMAFFAGCDLCTILRTAEAGDGIYIYIFIASDVRFSWHPITGADQRILLQNPADVLAPDIIKALTLQEFLPDQVELFLLGSAALGISDSVPWKAPGYFEFHGL